MKYDKEEKYILDVLENGNIELSTLSKEEIEAIKEAANSTFKKDKRITMIMTLLVYRKKQWKWVFHTKHLFQV